MANAESKAASLPPKLTVPMIYTIFLPALFIVILLFRPTCRQWPQELVSNREEVRGVDGRSYRVRAAPPSILLA